MPLCENFLNINVDSAKSEYLERVYVRIIQGKKEKGNCKLMQLHLWLISQLSINSAGDRRDFKKFIGS